MAVDIRTVCILHTDVDIVIQTVIQTVGIYHTDGLTGDGVGRTCVAKETEVKFVDRWIDFEDI